MILLVGSIIAWLPASASAENVSKAERIARMAMSTASLWMIEHHEHEIVEGLEKGDLKEAVHEAEELIEWMKGTPWLADLEGPAKEATASAQKVHDRLSAKDRTGAESAIAVMREKFHHLHHELMEVVAGKGEDSSSNGH